MGGGEIYCWMTKKCFPLTLDHLDHSVSDPCVIEVNLDFLTLIKMFVTLFGHFNRKNHPLGPHHHQTGDTDK